VRGRVYGNIYLCERSDGRPFDQDDEAVVIALAGAAGVAVENARLFDQVRASAEQFQRLLLPRLPDLSPLSVAAVYKASSERGTSTGHVGGDWYDALLLADGAIGAVIGDVVGHDLVAAAGMAETRNMLRTLLYDKGGPPGAVLAQLDRTLEAVEDGPVATVCLARIEPAGATLILFTDGLVEDRCHSIDHGLDALAALASAHADRPLPILCQALADEHPSDGHDDLAVLTIRAPGEGHARGPGAAA
jgi:serine phosphatase RsbU (regulator of sigma subunit)